MADSRTFEGTDMNPQGNRAGSWNTWRDTLVGPLSLFFGLIPVDKFVSRI